MSIKQTIKSLIGERNLGRYDYFRHPELKQLWGGAFNGQEFRRKIFHEICDAFDFKLIVETGTFRGNTTEYMAQRKIPIKTVEFGSRIYGYAAIRFMFKPLVEITQDDSRSFLKGLAEDPRTPKNGVFFYLDAHWNADLPLAEELSIIFGNWKNSIVMIDDFQVPDTEYTYDDYGDGKALTLDYINQVEGSDSYSIFFPALDQTYETGQLRGSVVICSQQQISEKLSQCETLRQWQN